MNDKKQIVLNKKMGSLDKLAALYETSTLLRTLIQLIPSIGSSTDFLISKAAQDYVRKRHAAFFLDIHNRLNHLETMPNINNEHLFDLINQAYSDVLKTHSIKKIHRFSKIISDFIVGDILWDEAETLNKLINDLSDTHVEILLFATRTPKSKSFDNLPVFYISKPNEVIESASPPIVSDNFPNLSSEAMRMFCSELISRNLLYNEGNSRPFLGGKNVMRKTELADWFLTKVLDI